MQIFARHELATNVPSNGHARLLLEGSWPAAAADAKKNQLLALDDLFDGRHAAIDAEAERLAERIAAAVRRPSPDQPSFADVNILRLRYAAVKWLRPLAWRRSLSPAMRPQHYDLHVSTDGEDAEYSALWQALAAADGCELQTVEAPTTQTDSPSAPFNNSAWRRRLARWSESLRQLRATGNSPTRVLLCGNPRLLDPLCAEFVRRGISTAWLYDRFAVQSGVRWSLRGVPTFTCDEAGPSAVSAAAPQLGESIRYDRVDLTAVVRTWLERRHAEVGDAQSRQARRIEDHVATYRPTHVVVDEDATPLPRMLVAAAQNCGARTAVVQHGACGIRFGFAPLKADRFLAADVGSQKQLTAWGVAADRVVVTGSPYRARFLAEVRAARRSSSSTSRRSILLLATVPPRERRPDAVEYHFTAKTYEQMLITACSAVAELPGCELVLRRHPRDAGDATLTRVLSQFPQLKNRISSRREKLGQLVAAADCVLSCASSSGIEAAAAGACVVQLLPAGSGNLLPAEWYGLLGTARTIDELRPLLQHALDDWKQPPSTSSESPQDAAHRLAEAVLYSAETMRRPHFADSKRVEAKHA